MMLGDGGSVTSDILYRIPIDSIGAEIGVWKGKSSQVFLDRARHLYMIDSWSIWPFKWKSDPPFEEFLSKYRHLVKSNHIDDYQRYLDDVYKNVCKDFMHKNVTIYRMTSDEWFSIFNEKLDWIYIDSDHTYEGCLKNLKNAAKITNTIFGDDYDQKAGVTQAVDFFEDNNDCIVTRFDYHQFEIRLLK